MRFELRSEVIGSLMTFFATNPIVVASSVKLAELVNVLTSLLSDTISTNKKINLFVLLAQESVFVMVEPVVLVY